MCTGGHAELAKEYFRHQRVRAADEILPSALINKVIHARTALNTWKNHRESGNQIVLMIILDFL